MLFDGIRNVEDGGPLRALGSQAPGQKGKQGGRGCASKKGAAIQQRRDQATERDPRFSHR